MKTYIGIGAAVASIGIGLAVIGLAVRHEAPLTTLPACSSEYSQKLLKDLLDENDITVLAQKDTKTVSASFQYVEESPDDVERICFTTVTTNRGKAYVRYILSWLDDKPGRILISIPAVPNRFF